MTEYYVDDGGSNTSPYDTWAKAAPDIKTLDAAIAFASGDIVYFGHDSVDVTSTGITVVGPTSGAPVTFISATAGSSPPEYAVATASQINSSAASNVEFDGSFALRGLQVENSYNSSTLNIRINNDADEYFICDGCIFKLPAGSYLQIYGGYSRSIIKNATFDLTNDGTSDRATRVIQALGVADFVGLSFISAGYRTASVFNLRTTYPTTLSISGCDFSGFTNATPCEIVEFGTANQPYVSMVNCKTAATWSPFADRPTDLGAIGRCINCGPSNAPTSLIEITTLADLISSTAIYRTSGAQFEGVSNAWLIVTQAACSEGSPYYCPWMVGTLDSTGSKTWTVYVTNDSADFTDAEVWLEVEFLGTSGSGKSTTADDHRTITATPAAQTDDTSSTWNGTGPSFTYKQKLSVTATVGQAGQYRARVVVGKASIASSAYFYIDPTVTVT